MTFTSQAPALTVGLEGAGMTSPFRPLGNYIQIEPVMDADVQSDTIVIPESVKNDEKFGIRKGRVLAVGEGTYTKTGVHLPVNVKVGEMIVFVNYGAAELRKDGVLTVVVREDNCLGTYESEEIKTFEPKNRVSEGFPVLVGNGNQFKQRKSYGRTAKK